MTTSSDPALGAVSDLHAPLRTLQDALADTRDAYSQLTPTQLDVDSFGDTTTADTCITTAQQWLARMEIDVANAALAWTKANNAAARLKVRDV